MTPDARHSSPPTSTHLPARGVIGLAARVLRVDLVVVHDRAVPAVGHDVVVVVAQHVVHEAAARAGQAVGYYS